MRNRLLYIGKKIDQPCSGGEQVNLRNQKLLEAIYGHRITYVETGGRSSFVKFTGGITNDVLKKVRKELISDEYNVVYISHSILGRVAKMVKKSFPDLTVICFFHNIELHYAKEYMRTVGLKAMPFFLITRHWEKICASYSDVRITLNERDAKLLEKYYSCHSDMILPTSFQDKFDEEKKHLFENQKEEIPIDYLFVGISFFANVQGVQWFIDHVMPSVDGHFWIIGKGMDQVNFQHLTERIHVLGFVASLDEYYYRARMVVSPIFSGAGMKTKTAEALMYGKRILGSKEAFEGYEICETMHECNVSEDYIHVINQVGSNPQKFYSPSRSLFIHKYDSQTVERNFVTWFTERIC